MLINYQCIAAKVAPNTTKRNLASNNLNSLLKAFTLTLHVKNRKHTAKLCIN